MGRKRAKTKSQKIVKDDSQEKRKKLIKYIVGGFLIFIMASSIFGVMLYADPSTQGGAAQSTFEADGYTFSLVREENAEFIQITDTPVGKESFEGATFFSIPSNLFDSYFTPSVQNVSDILLNANGVFLVLNLSKFDFTGVDQTFALDYQAQEIARSGIAEILSVYNVTGYVGFAEDSFSLDAPVVTCDNATAFEPVVMFEAPKEFNTDFSSVSVLQDNPYCIIFDSTDFRSTLDLSDSLKFTMVKN